MANTSTDGGSFPKRQNSYFKAHPQLFKEGELDESLVCAKFALPKKYGRREGYIQEAEATIYNLDVIISVGYRVKSQRGVQFRQWANRVLKQYLIKGYAINERLRANALQIVHMLP